MKTSSHGSEIVLLWPNLIKPINGVGVADETSMDARDNSDFHSTLKYTLHLDDDALNDSEESRANFSDESRPDSIAAQNFSKDELDRQLSFKVGLNRSLAHLIGALHDEDDAPATEELLKEHAADSPYHFRRVKLGYAN
jgi:hypothetical protein